MEKEIIFEARVSLRDLEPDTECSFPVICHTEKLTAHELVVKTNKEQDVMKIKLMALRLK